MVGLSVMSPVVQDNFVSFRVFLVLFVSFFQCFFSVFRVLLINSGCLAIKCMDFTFQIVCALVYIQLVFKFVQNSDHGNGQ